jgi:hypothetical protein
LDSAWLARPILTTREMEKRERRKRLSLFLL